jgi:serine/threonine protein phosphatase PrpC
LTTTTTTAERLTFDHRADDSHEIERIENTGGFVLKQRVVGILAVARSLGDHGMKDFVVCQPYLNTVEAQSGDLLILACDGLWDVLSDNESVQFVEDFKGNSDEAAQGLVNEAVKRGSTDNISVIVAWL